MVKNILDDKFLQKQKTILLKEKNRLERKLKTINKFPSYGDKEEENAMEVEQYEDNLGLKKGTDDQRKQVLKALKNMEKGKYGICEVCKGPIEHERLEAFPAATTCVKHSKK